MCAAFIIHCHVSQYYDCTVTISAGVIYGPALKALLAKAAGPNEQGALQGDCFLFYMLIAVESSTKIDSY